MKKYFKILRLICVLLGFNHGHAALLISAYEDGNKIIYSGFGSLDLTDANLLRTDSTFLIPAEHHPSDGVLSTELGDNPVIEHLAIYEIAGDAESWGWDWRTLGASAGDSFALNASASTPFIILPLGYESGALMDFTITVEAAFAPRWPGGPDAMDVGSYQWSLPNDNIYLNIGSAVSASPIPEPSTYIAIAGYLLVGAGVVIRWRRRKSADPATACTHENSPNH
ncbi:hypothetical protein [Cerasicoccus frondis]|uniref:hypothetical protein n=1 Tax=Cerasicoccus frondis TaxID=490090 RepID=UPI0028524FD5|nr:hypothetical protein [Cerasicoccus frondis]